VLVGDRWRSQFPARSGTDVARLRGQSKPVIPCLQSTTMLSGTVAHLRLSLGRIRRDRLASYSVVVRLGSQVVGSMAVEPYTAGTHSVASILLPIVANRRCSAAGRFATRC
jgi:hypothetical protein